MRDISAGRDIVNSTITEIIGFSPTSDILQQPAEELAEAERLSRRIVRAARKRRAKRAAIYSTAGLSLLGLSGLVGYTWLLQGGTITLPDLIQDASSIAVGAVISTLLSAGVGIACSVVALGQRRPTSAELVNLERLQNISTRWDELGHLGMPASEIRQLRRQRAH